MTRVRFPSPAPRSRFCQTGVVKSQSSLKAKVVRVISRHWFGFHSSPDPCRCPCGSVVEHSLGKGEVGSSILPMGTTPPSLLHSPHFRIARSEKHGQGKVRTDQAARERGHHRSR